MRFYFEKSTKNEDDEVLAPKEGSYKELREDGFTRVTIFMARLSKSANTAKTRKRKIILKTAERILSIPTFPIELYDVYRFCKRSSGN